MKRAKKKAARPVAKKKAVKAKGASKSAKPQEDREIRPSRSPPSTAAPAAPADGAVTWNFKLLVPPHCSTASAAWAKACRCRSRRTAAASSGSRTRARRRTSPRSTSPIRASPRWSARPTCRRATCAPTRWRPAATSWRSPTRPRRRACSRPAWSCSTSPTRRSRSSISFFDCSGQHSRGVHQLWFCDGEYVHMASSSADFVPTHPQDDQFYRCIDVRNPSKPVEVGRWHMPGTKQGDNVPPPPRHPLDKGYRAHNCNVYPQRPDRCYLAYIDGGMHVLDISDKAQSQAHLVLDQLAALHRLHAHGGAAVRPRPDAGDRRVDREQRQGLAEAGVDPRRPRRDQPRADLDLPAAGPQGLRGARPVRRPQHPRERAAADLLAVRPDRARHLLQRRACAPTTSPTRTSRRQVATFVPPAPAGAPTGTTQINDVFVDEREIVYCVDRHIGGLYCLEMDF